MLLGVYVSIALCGISTSYAIILHQRMKKQKEGQKKFLDRLQKETKDLLEKKDFFENEVKQLKHQIEIMEEKEKKNIEKKYKKDTKSEYTFKNKFVGKILVGNYQDHGLKEARELLRCFGLSVDCVTSGEAIVERIQNGEKYDLILTNNTYRYGIDGCDVVRELHEIENFDTPIVVQTIEYGNRESFLHVYGYDDYIEKPLKPEKIEEILEKFLKKAK